MHDEQKCHGHHKRFLAPIMVVVLIILSVYLVGLTRNSFKTYNYIGKSPEFQDRITISGTGKVAATPDVAVINVGVISESSTVARAQADNTNKMNNIIKAVKDDFDIDDDDIQTTQYRINPRYDYNEGRRDIVGYEVTQSLTIKVRDFDNVGAILTKAGDLGANSISGPNFTIDDPEVYRAQAREAAIEQAKNKAKVLAKQVGIKLGPIVNFSESSGVVSPYYGESLAFGIGGDAKAIAQIEPGTEEVSVSVSISYEIR